MSLSRPKRKRAPADKQPIIARFHAAWEAAYPHLDPPELFYEVNGDASGFRYYGCLESTAYILQGIKELQSIARPKQLTIRRRPVGGVRIFRRPLTHRA